MLAAFFVLFARRARSVGRDAPVISQHAVGTLRTYWIAPCNKKST